MNDAQPAERALTDADHALISRALAAGIDFGGHVDVVTNADDPESTALYHLLGTERANGEPSTEWEERRSRCYELAAYAFAFGDLASLPPKRTRALLVHGSMHGPAAHNVRIGHAWVEFGDRLVWEPVRALIRDRAEWEAHARPWAERSYSLKDARRLMTQSGHYGRWHESRYP